MGGEESQVVELSSGGSLSLSVPRQKANPLLLKIITFCPEKTAADARET